jgi:hypothetical protein
MRRRPPTPTPTPIPALAPVDRPELAAACDPLLSGVPVFEVTGPVVDSTTPVVTTVEVTVKVLVVVIVVLALI